MSQTQADSPLPGPIDDGTWDEVGAGESGARVFVRADGSQYAKQVPADQIADLAAERDRARWAADQGISGPQVVRWQAEETSACLVTSAVPGIPADQVGIEHLGRAWENIVDAVRELHQVPTTACPFDRGLNRMFSLARDVVARDAVHPEFLRPEQQTRAPGDLLEELAGQLPQHLDQETSDLVVCHGDLCLPNIVLAPDTLEVVGFIDLGRLGCADRHADISLLLANAQDAWPEHAQSLAEVLTARYGHPIDPDRLRFHLFLDPLTWG
ncbi:streptomycin 3'-kinase [Mycobacterium frederiksbergense]|uniref:Streptomycin 3'-kinase n=1 Tax=Mycolicibacterium frederiksbergense TaxID=117567 RepID=A0ABT6L4F7_9MYCO|nr:APH(3'') family aminoglycoside O-phosphotransferase [Mycolicibacterium frederiksbergense]MDH6197506.1 streptomycin 3'-kinase [Mycolicibacterium frederiksbergense]